MQALSGALCGPDIESPFLGLGSSAPSHHTCNVLHLTVMQRVKDLPFIGKVIVLEPEPLFVFISIIAHLVKMLESLATSGKVAADFTR